MKQRTTVIRTLSPVYFSLLRLALLVLTTAAAQWSFAQSTVVYEGTGRVHIATTTFGLLPLPVQVGDELRFRVEIDRTAPVVPLSEFGPGGDPFGAVFYRTPIRGLELWINDMPIALGPTSSALQQNIFAVRNDATIVPGFPTRDEFQFTWRQRPTSNTEVEFVAGLVADHQNAPVDWLTSDEIPTQFDFAAADGSLMGFRVSRFRVTNGFQEADFDEIGALPTAFYVVGGPGTPGTSAPPDFGTLPLLSQGETWIAAATTAQVPGAGGADGRRVDAGLWFNGPADEASFQLAPQGTSGVTRINIRCGFAGTEGPIVWSSTNVAGLAGADTPLVGRDLSSVAASATCPIAIRSVVTLKAAAEHRLLYFEVERTGPTLRGQFWPNSLSLHRGGGFLSHAGTSDQQVVGAEVRSPAWQRTPVTVMFSETSDSSGLMHYEVPRRHRFGSVTIHCAPAGVDGPAIAALPVERGVLSNADLIALPAGSSCGMSITTTAALLEALLRGHLYAVVEPIEPAGLTLRGQFRAP